MTSLTSIFWSFFKIGTFTIGGGYAMIPLMEKEIVNRHGWLNREEFLDLLSLSQAMPGIFAVNMATAVGQRLRGALGSVVAIVGNIMAPVAAIIALAVFFRHFQDNHVVDSIFKGVRPAVVALIAAPVFTMAKTAGITWKTLWIPVVAAALVAGFGVSPVWVVVAAAIAGALYGYIIRRKEARR
jgi:chromate transporter